RGIMKYLTSAIALVSLAFATSGWTEQPVKELKPTADRVKIVRQTYKNVSSEILGVVEPLKELHAAVAADGGPASVKVIDAKGNTFYFSIAWDHKKPISQIQSSLTFSKENGPSLLLPLRGPEEAAVYGLLLRAVANPPGTTKNHPADSGLRFFLVEL